MGDELREILKPYFYSNEQKILQRITAEIKSLFKSKLPKKKDPEQEFRRNVNYKLHPTAEECEARFNFQVRCQGYNQALTEIEKIVEEL